MSRPRNGGVPARRAVVRWAWRMFRREWRQQLVLVALLTLTVAAALVLITASYHADRPAQAQFGTATQLIRYPSDPPEVSQRVAAAQAWFGTIDVIGHQSAPIPGLNQSVEIRSQDPHGPYGGPMLRLVSGRYPTGAGEAAVTDEVATLTSVRVGGWLALDGHSWTVVGLVENPGNLDAEFVLVPPAAADPPPAVTILTAASQQRFDEFLGDRDEPEVRDQNQRTVAAAGVLGLVTLAMVLVGLVAVSGFIVVAQRRQRQFGLLAATGATERQVRLVLLSGGATIGTAAALLGAVVAVPVWLALVPRLETAGAHRIDRWDVPWWLVGAGLVLAVATAVGAAWWPARAAARTPVTQALSMRPPSPRPAHRSAVVAAILLVAGYVCLRLADQENVLLVLGLVAVTIGLLFLGPLAIRVAAAAGPRLPVAARLSLRDLARHQARSGTALAAISLALAVPAFVVVVTAANATPAVANLSDRQLMIRTGEPGTVAIPDRTPTQVAAVERAVREFAGTLGTPTVIGLDVAMDPAARSQPGIGGGQSGRTPVLTGIVVRDSQNRITGIHALGHGQGAPYIATPELARYLGIDPQAIDRGTDVLTAPPPEPMVLLPDPGGITRRKQPPPAVTALFPRPAHAALPTELLTPATVQRHGWETVRAGWLIEADQPLTTEQVAAARAMALANGLSVEARDTQASLLQLRVAATGAGAGLALGVLAMTVGLIRGESARDLRTLAATGATGRIRRTLTATTAGALALLGAVLGIGVAYLTAAAIYHDEIGRLSNVPIAELTVTLVGVPMAAAAAAWLLARREPGTLGRMRLD